MGVEVNKYQVNTILIMQNNTLRHHYSIGSIMIQIQRKRNEM